MDPRIAMLCVLTLLSASHVAMAAQEFDFFYFVLMWPGAYCQRHRCCRPTSGQPANDFFISSLKPYNMKSHSTVTECNDMPFDENQVSDLTSELNLYMSNIKCPSNNAASNWMREWETYGVCSGLDQRSYFQAALALREKVNLKSLLADNGIHPNDDRLYRVKDIKNAITERTGANPEVECNVGPRGLQQLYKIHICVDKDASTIIECPVYHNFSCSDKILYPAYQNRMLANPIRMPAAMV